VVVLLSALTDDAHAQPADDDAHTVRLYFAMGTLHLRQLDEGVENSWLLAASWRRLYAATFVNSFGERSYSAGVEGQFVGWALGGAALGLGYRVGAVTGYDERFIALAGQLPVLPLVQSRVTLDARRFGLELSYSGIIASAVLSIRL
jgi:hypothetical protein